MNTTAKYIKSLAFFVAGIALILPVLASQAASAYTTDTLMVGQSHYYDVQLRGDGSAVVNARLEVANSEDDAKQEYRYSAESGTLSDILAFQEIQCAGLPPYVPAPTPEDSTDDTTTVEPVVPQRINGEDTVTTTEFPECYPESNKYTDTTGSSRDEIIYYQPAYKTFYKKITVKQADNSFTLTLPKELASGDSTTIVLVYNLAGVAEKKLGVYEYDYKTLNTSERVTSSKVAISVDNDYVLEGSADDKVNYKSPNSVDIAESLNKGSNLSVSDSSVSSYVGTIGNNGTVTKSATNLAPQETLNVTGRYATSSFLLHWPRTVLRIVLGILLVIAFITWYRRRRKQLQKKQWAQLPTTESAASTATATPTEAVAGGAKKAVVEPMPATAPVAPARPSVININVQALPFYEYFRARRLSSAAFGWLCALIAGVFIGGIIWGIAALEDMAYVGYSGSYTLLAVVGTLSLCAAGILGFLLITVGLPFLYAPTFKSALKVITHIVLTFIVVALALAIAINATDSTPEPDYPQYQPYYNSPM